jgi:hypothetical protein
LKKLDLGQALQFLGNVGVIVGILLLVYELNQNRDMMRAQTRNELSQGLTDVLNPMASDDERADLLVRGNRGEELTASEAYRFEIHSELVFRYWENVHYQYRQALYDESEFSRHRDTMQVVMGESPGSVRFWCRSRMLYSVPFMEMIDELLASSETDLGCKVPSEP